MSVTYGTLLKIGPHGTSTSALNWLNVMVYKVQRSMLEAHAPALSVIASAVSFEHRHERKI